MTTHSLVLSSSSTELLAPFITQAREAGHSVVVGDATNGDLLLQCSLDVTTTEAFTEALRAEILQAAGRLVDKGTVILHDVAEQTVDDQAEPVRACRVCGCTDDAACEGGCSWVGPDLCSTCGPSIHDLGAELLDPDVVVTDIIPCRVCGATDGREWAEMDLCVDCAAESAGGEGDAGIGDDPGSSAAVIDATLLTGRPPRQRGGLEEEDPPVPDDVDEDDVVASGGGRRCIANRSATSTPSSTGCRRCSRSTPTRSGTRRRSPRSSTGTR